SSFHVTAWHRPCRPDQRSAAVSPIHLIGLVVALSAGQLWLWRSGDCVSLSGAIRADQGKGGFAGFEYCDRNSGFPAGSRDFAFLHPSHLLRFSLELVNFGPRSPYCRRLTDRAGTERGAF